MTDTDVARIVAEYADRFPPLINLRQAAEISQLPLGTIYDYSSRGLLDAFKLKVGRYRRLHLAGFIEFLVTKNTTEKKTDTRTAIAPQLGGTAPLAKKKEEMNE